MTQRIRITTPSRLHFGLLRFAQSDGPSYGGLGMMIDQPNFVIEFEKSEHNQVEGPEAKRALEYAKRAMHAWSIPADAGISINISSAPPSHAGLGSGTQLALAVAAGVRLIFELPTTDLEDLVCAVGRGKRSSIGSYGFELGGLIWESGYQTGQKMSQLGCRLDMPESWRVLLINPSGLPGLHGQTESRAFAQLPPIPNKITEQLQQIAEQQILPATQDGDFERFAAGVFQYGNLAGSCFASVQGGPYASRQIEGCINTLLDLGIAGVGQSSWGPTIFAFAHNEQEAKKMAQQISKLPRFESASIFLSRANNTGAKIEYSTLADSKPSVVKTP